MSSTPEVKTADVQAAFCAVLCDEWARAGVTDAVVAPGSRSTPMVAALDAEPRIRVTVVLDERSAGFVALGAALATGRPALVVTTSGTAAVELHPAVVEAGQANVALIAVTADRPPELHHVGAPQTVEQAGLFGGVVRWAADPGPPDLASSAAWRSLASRCVAEALAGPGPVHVNLAFREPLIGDPGLVPVPEGRPDGGRWHQVSSSVPAQPTGPAQPAQPARLAVGASARGVIVAGHGAALDDRQADDILEAASRLGWPVLADPRSGLRRPVPGVVAAADALLRTDRFAALRPDLVVRLGASWASRVVGQWLASLPSSTPQVAIDRGGRWFDPDRTASHVFTADPATVLGEIPAVPDPDWLACWQAGEKAAQAGFSALLDRGGSLELSEPAVARATLAAVPAGGLLMASSSMPVRDLEWYGAPRAEAQVLSNRGANGIDGVLSTALGAALAANRPTVALLGDLAFLYDAGAMLWAARRPARLSVVVVDNDGGGIFSFLPQASAFRAEQFEAYWGTAHGLDLAGLAGAYRVAAQRIGSRAELDDFLSLAGASESGVRVAVVPSDRAGNVTAHQQINAAVAGAVAGI